MQCEIRVHRGYRYIVYEFEKSTDSIILDEVKDKAKEDAKHMRKEDPSGEIRSDDVIYWRNIAGVLAERVVNFVFSIFCSI